MIPELLDRIRFWNQADRIGPDIPGTHWRLYFPSMMLSLCKRKFRTFHDSSEFRPGAYAIGCSRIDIGERVVVRPGSTLHADPREGGAGITIEGGVLLGSGVHIYVDTHRFENGDCPIIDQGFHPSRAVLLKSGCWIGANVVILPGVTVGENSVVGAGAVVTKNVPPRVVVAGNPATVIVSKAP